MDFVPVGIGVGDQPHIFVGILALNPTRVRIRPAPTPAAPRQGALRRDVSGGWEPSSHPRPVHRTS